MGNTYRLVLLDEFNWEYANFKKDTLVVDNPILQSVGAYVESSLAYMVIIACRRMPPSRVLELLSDGKVPFDRAYSQINNDPEIKILELCEEKAYEYPKYD